MAPETWAEYVARVTADIPQKRVAELTGIDQTGVSRWQRGRNKPNAEKVVAFAKALGRPPIEALLAAGYLTRGDVAAGVVEIHTSLAQFTTDELLAEIRRRVVDT
jgi:transcriptional regulator with XRE-family HTH domain